jgi:hypothetical protein
MFQGGRPFAGLTHSQVLHAVSTGKTLTVPKCTPEAARPLLAACLSPKPEARWVARPPRDRPARRWGVLMPGTPLPLRATFAARLAAPLDQHRARSRLAPSTLFFPLVFPPLPLRVARAEPTSLAQPPTPCTALQPPHLLHQA